MKTPIRSLIWFRRDLRLRDNPALAAAVAESDQLTAVFVHAPEEEEPWAPGAASRWYLQQSLKAFERALVEQNQSLIYAPGPSLEALLALAKQSRSTHVYWNRVYEPACLKRDKQVKQGLEDAGITVKTFHDQSLFPPGQIRTATGGIYKVFTPFWRQLSKAVVRNSEQQGLYALPNFSSLSRPSSMSALSTQTLDDLDLLDAHSWHQKLAPYWQAGEIKALQQFDAFLGSVGDYPAQRDKLAETGTSRLSAALHFGELSPWRLVQQLRYDWQGESGPVIASGTDSILRQLGWREFAIQWLFTVPDSPSQSIHDKYEQHGFWGADKKRIDHWKRGRTGYRLVDAAMQELWASGYMHNRARMVTASFLSKNLGQHWKHGAKWFWDTLVDADLANNTMGWQWVAGCGCDAAPFFRIFNPELQAKRFDPDGQYIQRWTQTPTPYPGELFNSSTTNEPIVELSSSREAALARYAALS